MVHQLSNQDDVTPSIVLSNNDSSYIESEGNGVQTNEKKEFVNHDIPPLPYD